MRQTKSTEMSATRVGQLLTDAMEEKQLSIKDLSLQLDITYEHVRRIVRGEAIPSKYVLKMFCQILGVALHEAELAATADRVQKRYGALPLELAGKKPGMDTLERLWDRLTTEQQASVTIMAQSLVKHNKMMRVGE